MARPGGPPDAVAGVVPRAVYTPADVAECAELLPRAGRVAFVGGGTELALGRPPTGLDSVIRTERLDRIVDYAPADMVMVVEAGVTLARLQAAARAERQMLAIDAPAPERATVGGVVATAAFGPRRARHGGVRDLIIGVTLVRADGAVARGGGKVVKNVAGFDLPRLVCGSLGTLALVASATFRLHPLPDASATAVAAGLTPDEVVALVARVRAAQLEPAAAVALRTAAGRYDLGVRFDGFDRGVREQLARLGGPFETLADDAPFWRRHDEARAAGPQRLKLAALPARLPAVEPLVAALGATSFAWYATLGLGFAAGAVADVTHARAALVAAGGSLVVETLHDDPWGPPPPAFGVMRELKQRFDPEGRLNPGRFVGGL